MLYNDFCGEKVSRLGYGAMRFPTDADGNIDEKAAEELIDAAYAAGVNYFDTAYVYNAGQSERILGKALSKYPRDSYFITDKDPGHLLSKNYDPAETFQILLDRCGVEYFDFFLLHNVFEKSMEVYTDTELDAIGYFVKQKELGRIKHLGFSSHARTDTLKEWLDFCDGRMDFCQIQLNYLDWTLQDAKGKYELLGERGIPIVVMEPLRGGKFAKLDDEWESKLHSLRPDESTAAWSFRWLMGLPNVKVTLSGMSAMDQLEDNLKTFSEDRPLSAEERRLLEVEIADTMKDGVPCTGCRYCAPQCPIGLDIPNLISAYNDIRSTGSMTSAMQIEFLPEGKRPCDCLACGACAAVCPQGIDIPEVMKDLDARFAKMGRWADVVAAREAANAKANAEAKK